MVRLFVKYVPLVVVCGFLGGCASPYLKDRGNDLSDIFDIGITISSEAQFRLDFQPFLFTLGYSDVEGKLIGFGSRNWGVNDFESKGWGALLTGEGKYGTGPFNPADPRQVWPVNSPNAPEEQPLYGMGLLPPAESQVLWTKYVECNKGIHLGWVGIHLPCRPLDLIDFVLGFTTLDIMQDDTASAEQ